MDNERIFDLDDEYLEYYNKFFSENASLSDRVGETDFDLGATSVALVKGNTTSSIISADFRFLNRFKEIVRDESLIVERVKEFDGTYMPK